MVNAKSDYGGTSLKVKSSHESRKTYSASPFEVTQPRQDGGDCVSPVERRAGSRAQTPKFGESSVISFHVYFLLTYKAREGGGEGEEVRVETNSPYRLRTAQTHPNQNDFQRMAKFYQKTNVAAEANQ